MEWVETTAKTIDEARNRALDQLGVADDEAEVIVIEEPRAGLFGRLRGEARVKARVRPTQVRPKQDRRRRGAKSSDRGTAAVASPADSTASESEAPSQRSQSSSRHRGGGRSRPADATPTATTSTNIEERTMSNDADTQPANDRSGSTVSADAVGAAAVAFMEGLVTAFGSTGTAELEIDGLELGVQVTGEELGLLVGPGGRTLNAIQDLARVAAQRRLGDHETRLRIDVAGYRSRREAALGAFARDVAEQVRSSGVARSLEPMTSADRKVVHDVLNEYDGVVSRSVGDDPDRRIIIEPA